MKKFKTIGMLILFSIALFGVYLEKVLAQSWGPGDSSQLQWYEMGGDPTVSHGSENAGFIRSKVSEPGDFGAYMTSISVKSYKGKRIRLSAYLKTENVSIWAALWMRADTYVNQVRQTLSFDNMYDRPLIGTNEKPGWMVCSWRLLAMMFQQLILMIFYPIGIILKMANTKKSFQDSKPYLNASPSLTQESTFMITYFIMSRYTEMIRLRRQILTFWNTQ